MEKSAKKFLTDTLSGRAALYEYLSLIFREPPKEDFIGLSGEFIVPFGALADSSGSETIMEGAELLRQYAAAEKSSDKTAVLRELNGRYTALFLLGFSSIPLTASAILTPGCVTRQEPWEKTLNVYKRWGYKKPAGFNEPEDHISVQLSFMKKMAAFAASLAENEDGYLMETLKAQGDFLKANMSEWVGLFNRALKKRVRASKCRYTLYEGGASLTEGYIKEDIKFLDMLIQ